MHKNRILKRINLNSKQIEIARCICIGRDGYNCFICGKIFRESSVAEIHHIDGNPNNNPINGSNWGLVHHSCNLVQMYVEKRIESIDGERPPPFEYSIGTKMELTWLRFMIDEITNKGSISWDQARYTGALEANCSPETTKRYLMKHVIDSDHPKSLFMSTLDQGYNSLIKFTTKIEEISVQNKQFI